MMMTVIPMHAFPFLQLFACLALLYLTSPYLTLPHLTYPTHNQAPLTTSISKEKKVQKDKKSSKQAATNNKKK